MVDRSSDAARNLVRAPGHRAREIVEASHRGSHQGRRSTTAPKARHMTGSDTRQKHNNRPCRTGAIHTCTNEFLCAHKQPRSLPRKRTRAPAHYCNGTNDFRPARTNPTLSPKPPNERDDRRRATRKCMNEFLSMGQNRTRAADHHACPSPTGRTRAPAATKHQRPNEPRNPADIKDLPFGPLPSLRSGFGPRAAPAPPSRRLPQDRYRFVNAAFDTAGSPWPDARRIVL